MANKLVQDMVKRGLRAKAAEEARKKAEDEARGNVNREAAGASRFGRESERDVRQLGNEAAAVRGRLGRLASGQDSISAEQLRQGLQQNMAGQQAMAASARPGNAAMAARTAAMQGARMGSGLAGQQAVAGIAERQSANQALGSLLMAQRGQDMQGALGGRGQALQGYGMTMDDLTQRWIAEQNKPSKPSFWDRALRATQVGTMIYGAGE
jgi:hypothetical protein